MRSMFPESKGPLSKVPGTGPAPILMRSTDWLRVVPEWERLTAFIEGNEEAKSKLGWVREMYAFSIAAALEVSSCIFFVCDVTEEMLLLHHVLGMRASVG